MIDIWAGDTLESRAYSRKNLRIQPDKPLPGKVRIIQINGRQVSSNTAEVRILDICLGGVGFASILRFPAGNKVVLELKMTLEGMEYSFEGFIRHSRIKRPYGYVYGFCFIDPNAELRSALLQIFSRQMIRQGRHIIMLKPDIDIWNQ